MTDPTRYPSLAVSPTPTSIALGMTYAGYEGSERGDRISAVMDFSESEDALHETLGSSISRLESRSHTWDQDGEPNSLTLSLRQSVWGIAKGVPSGAPVTGASPYGARTHSVGGDLAAINEVMNCVIETESQGLLVDFIPKGLPAPDTTSFEVNVAYLAAPWDTALEAREPLAFTRNGGDVIDVEAMRTDYTPARVFETDSVVSVELDVHGANVAAMFVMPTDGTSLTDFANALTPETLAEVRTESSDAAIALDMPKLDIASETINYYDALGFACPLYTLRTVLHGATVQIDEKGIKAAASTVNENWDTSGGAPVAQSAYVLDRPFLFFIYDHDTNFVLYSGRYAGQ